MTVPYAVRAIYRTARKNAIKRGISFSISLDDLDALWSRCAGCCEVSGIRFTTDTVGAAKRRPFAPSIDRIDSSAGYTLTNTRFVCVAANYAMNEWGEDVLLALVYGICQAKGVPRNMRRGRVPGLLPKHVRPVRTRHGIRFQARVRAHENPAGKEVKVGTYDTAEEAAEAREHWLSKALSSHFRPGTPEIGSKILLSD